MLKYSDLRKTVSSDKWFDSSNPSAPAYISKMEISSIHYAMIYVFADIHYLVFHERKENLKPIATFILRDRYADIPKKGSNLSIRTSSYNDVTGKIGEKHCNVDAKFLGIYEKKKDYSNNSYDDLTFGIFRPLDGCEDIRVFYDSEFHNVTQKQEENIKHLLWFLYVFANQDIIDFEASERFFDDVSSDFEDVGFVKFKNGDVVFVDFEQAGHDLFGINVERTEISSVYPTLDTCSLILDSNQTNSFITIREMMVTKRSSFYRTIRPSTSNERIPINEYFYYYLIREFRNKYAKSLKTL